MSAREASDHGEAADVVKRQVAAHWNRRAPNFDEDFGHSIRTSAERAAWDRIFQLVLPRERALELLGVCCGLSRIPRLRSMSGFGSFDRAGAWSSSMDSSIRRPPHHCRRMRVVA